MDYRGRVRGGVIVLADDIKLPEGSEVMVVPCDDSAEKQGIAPEEVSVWAKMTQLADWADTQPSSLPEDLAANHDHYLHGLPKRK